jgi:hypothetical protein
LEAATVSSTVTAALSKPPAPHKRHRRTGAEVATAKAAKEKRKAARGDASGRLVGRDSDHPRWVEILAIRFAYSHTPSRLIRIVKPMVSKVARDMPERPVDD